MGLVKIGSSKSGLTRVDPEQELREKQAQRERLQSYGAATGRLQEQQTREIAGVQQYQEQQAQQERMAAYGAATGRTPTPVTQPTPKGLAGYTDWISRANTLAGRVNQASGVGWQRPEDYQRTWNDVVVEGRKLLDEEQTHRDYWKNNASQYDRQSYSTAMSGLDEVHDWLAGLENNVVQQGKYYGQFRSADEQKDYEYKHSAEYLSERTRQRLYGKWQAALAEAEKSGGANPEADRREREARAALDEWTRRAEEAKTGQYKSPEEEREARARSPITESAYFIGDLLASAAQKFNPLYVWGWLMDDLPREVSKAFGGDVDPNYVSVNESLQMSAEKQFPLSRPSQEWGTLGKALIDTAGAAGHMAGQYLSGGIIGNAAEAAGMLDWLGSFAGYTPELGASLASRVAGTATKAGAKFGLAALQNAGNSSISLASGMSSFTEAREQGASFDAAVANGVLKGFAEYFSNKLFSGTAFEDAPGEKGYITRLTEYAADKIGKSEQLKTLNASTGGKLFNWLFNKAGEGLEEVVTGIADPLIDKLTYNWDADMATVDELVEEFVGGVLLSTMLAPVDAVQNRAQSNYNRRTGRAYKIGANVTTITDLNGEAIPVPSIDAGVAKLIEEGLANPAGTESRKLALTALNRAKAGKTISEEDIGRLANANRAEVSRGIGERINSASQAEAVIRAALALPSDSTAYKLAERLMRDSGQTTDQQIGELYQAVRQEIDKTDNAAYIELIRSAAAVATATKPVQHDLSEAVDAYQALGMKKDTAQQKAAIIQKVWQGVKLTPKEIRPLNLTDAKFSEVFAQLTGVTVPQMIDGDKLGKVISTTEGIERIAAFIQSQRAEIMRSEAMQAGAKAQADGAARMDEILGPTQAAAEMLDSVDQAMRQAQAEREQEARAAQAQAAAAQAQAEVVRKLSEITVTDAETGQPMSFAEFVEKARAQQGGADATDEELQGVFALIAMKQGVIDEATFNNLKEEIINANRTGAAADGGGLSGNAGEHSGVPAESVSGRAGGAEAEGSGRRATENAGGKGSLAAKGSGTVRKNQTPSEREGVNLDQTPVELVTDSAGRSVMSQLPDSEFQKTTTARTLGPRYKALGLSFGGMVGNKLVYDNEGQVVAEVNGDTLPGKSTVVRLDGVRYTGVQLGGHELGHHIIFLRPEAYDAAIIALSENMTAEELEELRDAYEDAFHDAYAKDADGRDRTQEELDRRYLEEILCDAYGNMDRAGTNASAYHDVVAEIFDAAADEIAGGPLLQQTPEGRFSIDSITEAGGLTFEKDGQVTVLRDSNGKSVTSVTEDMLKKSPLGAVIQANVESGFLTKQQGKDMRTLFAGLYNLLLKTQDIDLIWAVNSTIGFQPIKGRDLAAARLTGLKSRFAAFTKNSDPQYSTTVDFTTICLKTQAVIDAMSATMKKLGHGLTEDEIIDIVYRNVYEAGEPVPCPVCYVFSRWVGLGGLFDKMLRLQAQYENVSADQIRADIAALEQRVVQYARDNGLAEYNKKGGISSEARNALYKELYNEYDELAYKAYTDKVRGTDTLTQAERDRMKELEPVLRNLDNWTWLTDVRLSENYTPVPADILLDINAGKTFAEQYPESWRYRTTRGPAMGKAATPYADEHLGQILRGAGLSDLSDLGDSAKNPFLDESAQKGELSKDGLNALLKSRAAVKRQNLLNGQRFQSTSDFRFEYALDYLMAFTEMQLLGSKVQLYTKVPEAVHFFASVQAEVNCSLMPYGSGVFTDANGNKSLVFSDVTGMSADDAFRLQNTYDNVQTILVGISDEHIRLAMADPRILFIIPYHASGASEGRYIALMDIVGESVPDRDDYSNYQTDHENKNANARQKAARDIRVKLLTGNLRVPSAAEAEIVRTHPILSELYKRFYGTDVDGNVSPIDQRYLPAELRGQGDVYRDPECFNVFLTSDQAKTIMPFEYWDRTTTIRTADENGRTFAAYAESLGLHPRFSGWDAKGNYDASKDFSQESGYWKTLGDRRLYNRDGSYHEQQAIDVTNFDARYLFRDEAVQGITKPSQVNNPEATEAIAAKSAREITERRAQAQSDIEAREAELGSRKKSYKKDLKSLYKSLEGQRYSVAEPDEAYMPAQSTDNQGRQLSIGQEAYFQQSKVRDDKGNLLTMYHGTSASGFTVFDHYKGRFGLFGLGFYFTDNRDVAEGYTKKGRGTTPGVYEVYLNITNPIDMDAPVDLSAWQEAFRAADYDESYLDGAATNEDAFRALKEYCQDAEMYRWEAEEAIEDTLRGMGYDGITHVGGGRYGSKDGPRHRVYIAFDSEQIKRTDNKNPTADPDMRYSISDDLQKWIDLQTQYGVQPESAGSVRPTEVPKRTAPGNKVSHSVPTIMGANPIPDFRQNDMKSAVVQGKFSYTPTSNKIELNKALQHIKSLGWRDCLREFLNDVDHGRSGAQVIARGAVLLNNAANGDATGEEFIELAQAYSKLLRAEAQGLQAAKILQQLTPEARLYGIQKSLARINEEYMQKLGIQDGQFEGITIDPALIEAFLKATTDEERDAIVERMAKNVASQMRSTPLDLFTQLRFLNMLGNAKTQIRNLFGNAGFQPVRMIKDDFAWIAEVLLQKAGVKNVERTASIARDAATWKTAGQLFQEYRDAILAGGKYNDESGPDFTGMVREEARKRVFTQTKWKAFNRTAGKALAKYQQATDWAMNKGDEIFCAFTFRDSLARFMAANHTTWDKADDAMRTRAVNKAIRDAAEATYRDNNAIATWASRAARSKGTPPLVKKIAEGVMPFRKTPVNIALRAYEFSPLSLIGNTITDIKAARGKAGKAKFSRTDVTANDIIQQWAKTFTGTGLAVIGYILASMGKLIGAPPDNDKEKELFAQQGLQKYSLVLGDRTLTIDWLAPEAIPLFLGANLAQTTLENGWSLEDGLKAAMRISDPLITMSMLQGVNDAIENAASYGNDSALPTFITNALWSYLTQGTTNTLVGQFERTAQGNVRMQTYVDKNTGIPGAMQKALGKTSAKIPGWDYKQIPYIDAWGDPQTNAGSEFENAIVQIFSPSYVTIQKKSEILDEIDRVYKETHDSEVILARAPTSFRMDNATVHLTADEYITYAVTRGQAAKSGLSELFASAQYKKMTPEQQADAIHKVYDRANQLGKEAAVSYEPASWISGAEELERDYGIPAGQIVAIRQLDSEIEGVPDLDGDSIALTKSLKQMEMLYQQNLTDKQRKAMADYLGVSPKVRDYTQQEVKDAIAAIPTEAEMRAQAARQTEITNTVQQSSLWKNATEAQQTAALGYIKDLVNGNSTGRGYQEKIDEGAAYGLDETEYMLFKLSLKMNNAGSNSITNEEREAAVRAVPGLTKDERDYLWISSGGSPKSTPTW